VASFSLIVILVIVRLGKGATGFDDIEAEAALEFHAGRAKDRAKRTGGATLFADDLADVAGSDMEAEDGGFLFGESFDTNGICVVYERARDFRHQGLHFRNSQFAVDRCD
jgi:hypothetical protein